MTLLLTLAAPWAIHQSSDYRLTYYYSDGRITADDTAGAKQLTVRSRGLVAQLCFTGLAQVANLTTRDWISQIIAQAAQPIDIDVVATEIAAQGTEAKKKYRPCPILLESF